jgi:hypothetical protein
VNRRVLKIHHLKQFYQQSPETPDFSEFSRKSKDSGKNFGVSGQSPNAAENVHYPKSVPPVFQIRCHKFSKVGATEFVLVVHPLGPLLCLVA